MEIIKQSEKIDDKKKEDITVISMNDFLEFLKITCQVNNVITSNEPKFTTANGVSWVDCKIDYKGLARNELINGLLGTGNHQVVSNAIAKSDDISVPLNSSPLSSPRSGAKKDKSKKRHSLRQSTRHPMENRIHPALSEKLDEVIDEGILDSVIPYLCPDITPAIQPATNQILVIPNSNGNKPKTIPTAIVQPQPFIQKPMENQNRKNSNDSSGQRTEPGKKTLHQNDGNRRLRRKSQQSSPQPVEHGVTIHVCDEVKNVSRDFICPKEILVSQMGYFADVTAGQCLEDMDISVHCDLQIFEWLMRWVKRENIAEEMWPLLDAANVVPILVSANFLQMEPLLLDCLTYCHSHLSDVVKVSANLSCLNDTIVSRLAAMFTNLELDNVKDKKERVTPRLWTKLIQSLCEVEPQSLRGHYASLSDLFRCDSCGKYLTQSISSYIACDPGNMSLNRWGQVISQHVRDHSWNITHYVSLLYMELKSWRRVYWRLWGNCHFLYCAMCETPFPAYLMNWCPYHPELPQYFGPISEGRMAGPVGRYTCCGQQAFRYDVLPGPSGCQYREHTIQLDTDRDRAILQLANHAGDNGCLYQTAPSHLSKPAFCEPWWMGIPLAPPRDRLGLLPYLNMDDSKIRIPKLINNRQSNSMISSTDSDSSDSKLKTRYAVTNQFSTSSEGCESELSSPNQSRRDSKFPGRRKFNPIGRFWCGEMSARSNQDYQRDFEERAMKHIVSLVNKKTGIDSGTNNCINQHRSDGGTFVRLEANWRDGLKLRGSQKKGTK